MSAADPRAPERRPGRGSTDPLLMSPAEKLACEWEARHDVAARAKRGDHAPVQHYLSHARAEQGLHPPVGGRPRPPAERRRADLDDPRLSAFLRSWFRWGEDGHPAR